MTIQHMYLIVSAIVVLGVVSFLAAPGISTTRLYDRRSSRLEDSPTYRVDYFKRAGSMGVGEGEDSP